MSSKGPNFCFTENIKPKSVEMHRIVKFIRLFRRGSRLLIDVVPNRLTLNCNRVQRKSPDSSVPLSCWSGEVLSKPTSASMLEKHDPQSPVLRDSYFSEWMRHLLTRQKEAQAASGKTLARTKSVRGCELRVLQVRNPPRALRHILLRLNHTWRANFRRHRSHVR